MDETQSTVDEPPDSQRYRSRAALEESLQSTTRGAIIACDALIEGRPLNGEARHLSDLATHLRSRIKKVQGKPAIFNTTYLGGITQMLTSYGGNVPTGLTFPPELERFAGGLENLENQDPEEIKRYRCALKVFATHMEGKERRGSNKYM